MAEQKTALEGIRILDLSRYEAGPRMGSTLARLGAEVIKVEALDGDESRQASPMIRGQSGWWVQYNSGKKSLALDLRKDRAKEIIKEIVKKSDIFVQNFRPGTIEKMGLSYDVLSELNPGIIMLNVSAYGQYGPYKDRVGFDTIGQAISGFMSITGYPENPPTRAGHSIIDRMTALHGAIGVLTALWERQTSGKGQTIDVCLADTGYSITEIPMTKYLELNEMTTRTGNFRKGKYAGAYQTKDGWVAFVGISQNMWPRICNVIGKPEWIDDPRFIDRAAREEQVEIIIEELKTWFFTQTMDEAVSLLSEASVACTPINDIAQASKDPHMWERECMVKVPDPIAGSIHVSGNYIKLGRSKTVVGPAPAVGEHNEDILCGLLNYSTEQVQQLRDEMVVR